MNVEHLHSRLALEAWHRRVLVPTLATVPYGEYALVDVLEQLGGLGLATPQEEDLRGGDRVEHQPDELPRGEEERGHAHLGRVWVRGRVRVRVRVGVMVKVRVRERVRERVRV